MSRNSFENGAKQIERLTKPVEHVLAKNYPVTIPFAIFWAIIAWPMYLFIFLLHIVDCFLNKLSKLDCQKKDDSIQDIHHQMVK